MAALGQGISQHLRRYRVVVDNLDFHRFPEAVAPRGPASEQEYRIEALRKRSAPRGGPACEAGGRTPIKTSDQRSNGLW